MHRTGLLSYASTPNPSAMCAFCVRRTLLGRGTLAHCLASSTSGGQKEQKVVFMSGGCTQLADARSICNL